MIYLDDQYRCHMENDGGNYCEWEDTGLHFAGKSRAFIEGYRVVPEGVTWTDSDGRTYEGLMISPAVSFDILQAAQTAYEETRDTLSGIQAVQDAMLGAAEGEDRLEAAERFALRIENAERAADLVAGEKVRG